MSSFFAYVFLHSILIAIVVFLSSLSILSLYLFCFSLLLMIKNYIKKKYSNICDKRPHKRLHQLIILKIFDQGRCSTPWALESRSSLGPSLFRNAYTLSWFLVCKTACTIVHHGSLMTMSL